MCLFHPLSFFYFRPFTYCPGISINPQLLSVSPDVNNTTNHIVSVSLCTVYSSVIQVMSFKLQLKLTRITLVYSLLVDQLLLIRTVSECAQPCTAWDKECFIVQHNLVSLNWLHRNTNSTKSPIGVIISYSVTANSYGWACGEPFFLLEFSFQGWHHLSRPFCLYLYDMIRLFETRQETSLPRLYRVEQNQSHCIGFVVLGMNVWLMELFDDKIDAWLSCCECQPLGVTTIEWTNEEA